MAAMAQHREFPVVIDPLAIAILMTAFLLPASLTLFNSRELYQLPVSRRTWWRSLWLLRTLLLPGLVGVAMALRQQESYALVWSSRCIIYPVTLVIAAGIMIRIAPVLLKLGVTRERQGVSNIIVQSAATIGALPFGLLLFVSPFFFAPYLPHVRADFGIWWILGYVAAATYGAGSFFHEPPIEARAVVRSTTRPVRAMPHESYEMPKDAPRVERLTGLTLAFYAQARLRLIGLGTAFAGAVVFWVVLGMFRPVPSLPDAFIRAGVLPFAEPRLDLAFVPMSMILLAVLMADSSSRPLNLLVLRAIPLPAWRISLLPLLTGMATAMAIYATQVGLYVITGHVHFATWRLDVLIVAGATIALVDLLRHVTKGSGIAAVLVLFGIPLFRTDLDLIVSQSTYFFAGFSLLAGTWLASWILVSRSSFGYRRARGRSSAAESLPQL